MNKIQVLVEGYARQTDTGWIASSSTTLIQTEKHNIIVDPGINKNTLLKRLKRAKLSTKDIDYVFLTHYHPDHILLAAIFDKATFFDSSTIYKDDSEVEFSDVLPDTNIKIIPTPGHAYEHASLIVKTEDLGTVVIAADVFWWTEEEKQDTSYHALISKEDPFTRDHKALIESRKKVIEIADWIIPGHGKMFQAKKGKV